MERGVELGDPPDGSIRLFDGRSVAGGSLTLAIAGGDGFSVEFDISSSGRCVEVSWSKPAQLDSNVDALLLGPALRTVLQVRRALCLHAGALSVGERAVAIVGPKGAGKSSTVAALASGGLAVLTDDLLVLDERDDAVWAQPGLPRMCLWPETLTFFGEDWRALPRVLVPGEKRRVSLATRNRPGRWRFDERPRSLAAIYVLGDYVDELEAPIVRRVAQGRGLMAVIPNAQGPVLSSDRSGEAEMFEAVGRLVRRVPVYEVLRPPGLEALPALADAISAHVNAT